MQVIHPAAEVSLPRVDLGTLPPEAREAEAWRLARAEAERPFDLARGPLLRAALLRLSETSHVLLLTVHHIVSDGWSTGVLVREMAALYAAFLQGRPSPLPALPLQYADFAAWQRGWLAGEVLEAELAWWRAQLDGAPPALELPTDRPRGAVESHRGALMPVRFPKALSDALHALCRKEGVTPFMALLAAFQSVLARTSGQDNVSVGSPIAGRSHAELEGLIGFFLNTLVLRTRFDGDPTVRELLGRVRETTLGAYAHPHLPFEQIQPMRDLQHSPLFRVMFVLQNLPAQELALPGLSLRTLEAQQESAKFDLTLTLAEGSEGFSGALEYSTDLFDAETAARLVRQLLLLVGGMVADSGRRISALPLLTSEEEQRLLVEWRSSRAPFPEDACLHQLVEARARQAPGAIAVAAAGVELTYGELDTRANQLARHLMALGAGPETRVGLCVTRSLELIVGMLGILKSGAAYLPLDPTLPPERLAFLLEDSGAPLVVAQRATRARLPAQGTRVVCLDEARDALAKEDRGPVPSAVGPRNLAYVIYTSGSTGKPKGVLVEHRSVCNLVTQEQAAYGLGPGSRMLQFASVGFDISVEEVFTTLASGGALWLAPADESMPGEPLQRLLGTAAITAVSLTPAALAATSAEGLPALRTVISGGEACPADVVARWSPGRRFFNTYGPTEGTVIATLVECVADGRAPSHRPAARQRAGLRAGRAAWRRCRWACAASCTSAAWAWRAATWRARR